MAGFGPIQRSRNITVMSVVGLRGRRGSVVVCIRLTSERSKVRVTGLADFE